MQIVINLDEDVYTRLFDNGVPTSLADGIVIDRAIRTGKVLPKHGRLIDADKLLVHEMYGIWGGREIPCVLRGDIEDADTILESDMVESQESEE